MRFEVRSQGISKGRETFLIFDTLNQVWTKGRFHTQEQAEEWIRNQPHASASFHRAYLHAVIDFGNGWYLGKDWQLHKWWFDNAGV